MGGIAQFGLVIPFGECVMMGMEQARTVKSLVLQHQTHLIIFLITLWLSYLIIFRLYLSFEFL